MTVTSAGSPVTPLFPDQYSDAVAGRVADPVRLDGSDGDLWIRATPMQGRGVMGSVLSVIHAGPQGVAVMDPGWPGTDMQTEVYDPLDGFLRGLGHRLGDINTVVATHGHPDHIGVAGPLAEITGARLVLGEVEQSSIDAARSGTVIDDYVVDPVGIGAPTGLLEPVLAQQTPDGAASFLPRQRPDVLLEDADRIGSFDVVLTPGHTPGHLCLVDREAEILLAADQILPVVHPGIGLGIGELGGNPVDSYLASLDRLAEFDGYRVVPGHGFVFTGLGARRLETAEHVLARADEVAGILEWDPGVTVWDLASRLHWSGGWEKLQAGPLLVSGLRQTMMYRDLVLTEQLAHWRQVFG